MTEAQDGSIREQVAIMVVTTAIEFACGFGALALFATGWIDLLDGNILPKHVVALPLAFLLTLWTGYHAMMLICRPTRAGFAGVCLRAVAAMVPIVAMDLL